MYVTSTKNSTPYRNSSNYKLFYTKKIKTKINKYYAIYYEKLHPIPKRDVSD